METEKAICLFMEYCHSKGLRPKSLLAYEQATRLFSVWLQISEQIFAVEDVRESDIRRYVENLRTRGKYTVVCLDESVKYNHPQNRRDYKTPISNETINNYIRILKVFFNWLCSSELIPKSPMKRIKEIPSERSAREYLTDDEVKRLMKEMDKSYYPEYRDMMIMMIMLDSGTRLGETLSIEIDQVNILEHTIRLPADKTKGRKERTVFFSARTANELRRWLQFKDRYCESDYLFPVKHTGKIVDERGFETNFQRYISRAGITKHISPHTLRNNFAKRCLMSGMDIYTLSRILGHSSVTVTEKANLDVTDSDLKKKYSRFSPLEDIYK